MTNKILFFAAIVVFVIGVVVWNIDAKTEENRVELMSLLPDAKATVVASPTCGCCTLYSQYLGQQGFDVSLDRKSQEELTLYKNDNLVPASLRSCHTSRIGKYIVEGHVPMEAIEKLLKEQPDIRGIGMAGMPSGSPGMPGPKEPFIIDIITNDGEDGGLFLQL